MPIPGSDKTKRTLVEWNKTVGGRVGWSSPTDQIIPESAKPGFYARVRRMLQAEHLAGAMVGMVVLAGLVNMIELLCTAGFPAVCTQILTMQQVPTWKYYGHLGLYNLASFLDDRVVVTIAVVTLSRRTLQERAGRWLKLMSGLIMIGLGIMLLFRS
ncbi:MAG: hypothetical protein NNA20_09635 [Nitrospira sp.]|nr:hypothetical protein [Nitrospira sp.]